MITFDEKRKLFHLFNKNFSYYFYINKLGYLIHLYCGNYLEDVDIERLTERYAERHAYLENGKEVCDESYYFSLQSSNFECATYGTADKRGAFAIINNVNNSCLTDFRYISHTIKYGKEEIKGLPHARIEKSKNVQTLSITLKDIRSNVYLILYYSIFDDLNVLIRNCKVINKENFEITINRINSLELDLFGSDYDCLSLHGTWSMDRLIDITPINHNKTIISDSHGARGFIHNPAIMIKESNANYEYGNVYSLSLIYSGDFCFELGKDEFEQVRVLAGVNSENFSYTLNNSEEFIAPECVLCFSNKGINGVTNTLHDFTREYIINKKFTYQERPILINSWEAFYFDFDTNKIKNFLDEANKLGIELVVLDDGWFGKRNNDKCSLGDWDVNSEKINLNEIIDYAHSKKMKIGIWIEPEMISFDSNLYNKHPEYALYNRKIKPTLLRHQLTIDLTNQNVRDVIFKKIEHIFDNYKFDYCKWDFNRFLSEIGTANQTVPEGEICYRFTLGTYDLLEKFTKKYSNILLETCASGGGRFDLGMLYYSPQIWCSDETDPMARVEIQFATNLFYPLSAIGSHVSLKGNVCLQDKAIIAAFGTFGYELDPCKLSSYDKNNVIEINNLIKTWHHIITLGDYYVINDPNTTNYATWSCVLKNKKEALVFDYNFRREPTRARYIKLVGLDKDSYYFNSLTNTIMKGDFYMNVGLNISAPLEEGKSMLFILKIVGPLEKTIFEKMNSDKSKKRDKII